MIAMPKLEHCLIEAQPNLILIPCKGALSGNTQPSTNGELDTFLSAPHRIQASSSIHKNHDQLRSQRFLPAADNAQLSATRLQVGI